MAGARRGPGPPPALGDRSQRGRLAAHGQRRRPGAGRVQWRDLQLPGASRRAWRGRISLSLALGHRGAGARLPPLGPRAARPHRWHVRFRHLGRPPTAAARRARSHGQEAALLRLDPPGWRSAELAGFGLGAQGAAGHSRRGSQGGSRGARPLPDFRICAGAPLHRSRRAQTRRCGNARV